ncbi:MAG: hypothetical protein QOE87_2222 [Gaiellales bacterium]|jgi:hypothetical protein|nr:hypothetical protein [Gaiellales bacterium]
MNATHLPLRARDRPHAPPERSLGIHLAEEVASAVQSLVALRWRAAGRARRAGLSDARVEARVARRVRRLLVEAQYAEQIRADVPVDTLIGSLTALLEGHAATREVAGLAPPHAHVVTRLFLEAAGHRPARGPAVAARAHTQPGLGMRRPAGRAA